MTPLDLLHAGRPREALRAAFVEARRRHHYGRWELFCARSWTGTDGVGYGSYNHVQLDELVGRLFVVEGWDYRIGIHYVDQLHNLDHWKNKLGREIPNPNTPKVGSLINRQPWNLVVDWSEQDVLEIKAAYPTSVASVRR